jgi:hypothetical protein
LIENLDYVTLIILIENLVMLIGRHLRSREMCVMNLPFYDITTALRYERSLG